MGILAVFNKHYARVYDLFNKDKKYKEEVEFVYKWAGKPRKILDIGCGTADYWRYFPNGAYLQGVERSKAMAQNKPFIETMDITKRTPIGIFDCMIALFDVLNYIPTHKWWAKQNLVKGGYFIFDIWDTNKIKKDRFRTTTKVVDGFTRVITPIHVGSKSVRLNVQFFDNGTEAGFSEIHTMYLHSIEDIGRYCGKEFEIVDVKPTKSWQTWFKCKRR